MTRRGKTEPGSISLYGDEWAQARRLAHEDGIAVTELFRRLLREERKRRNVRNINRHEQGNTASVP